MLRHLTVGRAGVLLLGAGVLAASVGFAAFLLLGTVLASQRGSLAYNDFFAQWSFAVAAHLRDPLGLYDYDALHRFQTALEPELRQFFPYPYPPTYLLAIWPLGWLSFTAAQLAWDAATLALFLWAVFGRRMRTKLVAFVLLAPPTVICLAYGQNGLLISALIVAGLRVMRTRPVVGGVLLGMATIKPQLGLLVPFALLAARKWRVIVAAVASAAVLAFLSVWAFGAAMWPAWLGVALGHAGWVGAAVNDYRKPTVLATLTLFGAPASVAYAVQGAVTLAVIALVCLCFRRSAAPLSIAALESGTFLAMPFVFHYDLPMLVNAIVLLVRERQDCGKRPGPVEAGVIALAFLFPALTMLTSRFFYMNTVALALLFALIVWRHLASSPRAPARFPVKTQAQGLPPA